jgi:LEA14-like dessication related protein
VKTVARLAIVVAVVVGGACASLGRATFKEPIVVLRDARLTGLGVSGGSVDVVLAVYNPNSFRLDGSRLTYQVLVDSVMLASGVYDERFVVERGDTAELRLPLTFTYSGIGAAGRQLMQNGSVEYRVMGDVTVATPLGRFTRPYQGKGRFSTLARTP